MEYLLSLLVGISLSATSGFRVFVPLLVMSTASLAGWLELSPAFEWIGSYPALAAFAVAALLFVINPGYLRPLVADPRGLAMTGFGLLSLVSGMVVLHRMGRLDV